MSDYLSIPSHERGSFEFVRCNKCSRNVDKKCGLSGKRISACKFGDQHRFRVEIYIQGSGNKRIRKTFKTRSYSEFKIQAVNYIQQVKDSGYLTPEDKGELIESNNVKVILNSHKSTGVENVIPESAEAAVQGNIRRLNNHTFHSHVQQYLDWMQGVGVASHKRKNYSKEHVEDIARKLSYFAKSLVEVGVNAMTISIFDIGEKEVEIFHEFLETALNENDEQRFGKWSYNKAMGVLTQFFKYLIEKKRLDVINPFEDVKRKGIVNNPEIIHLSEFDSLLSMITKKNGRYIKLDRGKAYELNHYQTWLKHAFRLFLETGERRDGVTQMRWSHVKDNWIDIPNYKINNQNNRDDITRKAPMTSGLLSLLKELGWEKHRGSEAYIIAPEIESRSSLNNRLSKAFTHFWKLTGSDRLVTLRHLRKTYGTLMYSVFGSKTEAITGQNIDTIIEYYLSKEKILSLAPKISLQEIESNKINLFGSGSSEVA
jgi:integrase